MESYEYRGMMAAAWDLLRGDTSNWEDRFFSCPSDWIWQWRWLGKLDSIRPKGHSSHKYQKVNALIHHLHRLGSIEGSVACIKGPVPLRRPITVQNLLQLCGAQWLTIVVNIRGSFQQFLIDT